MSLKTDLAINGPIPVPIPLAKKNNPKPNAAPYPVISAPSGLTLGGGFEVLVQSNFVASHTNIVIGLVETIVGLIPAGGGCKEMLGRWLNTDEAKKDPNFAPLKVFDIIGYGRTATSPVEAEPLKKLLPENKKIMNNKIKIGYKNLDRLDYINNLYK